ncbi:hypothetical protein PsorP6_010262 [Peronosclerospora sorghi]|uniref:Uncharacterized protein n=1 Tax=Peronosclerospora sorghi TaxID=230839 RepID=A0ACC0VVX4_9STRA|nr:hypothetical protein PsorP6_010262 [Peronosclerospora sorghi]
MLVKLSAEKHKVRKAIFPNASGGLKPGEVTYNGIFQDDLKQLLPKFVAYGPQRYKCFPTITVKETLESAYRFCGGNKSMVVKDKLLNGIPEENKTALETAEALFAHNPEIVIRQIGLENCQDTILGAAWRVWRRTQTRDDW